MIWRTSQQNWGWPSITMSHSLSRYIESLLQGYLLRNRWVLRILPVRTTSFHVIRARHVLDVLFINVALFILWVSAQSPLPWNGLSVVLIKPARIILCQLINDTEYAANWLRNWHSSIASYIAHYSSSVSKSLSVTYQGLEQKAIKGMIDSSATGPQTRCYMRFCDNSSTLKRTIKV